MTYRYGRTMQQVVDAGVKDMSLKGVREEVGMHKYNELVLLEELQSDVTIKRFYLFIPLHMLLRII